MVAPLSPQGRTNSLGGDHMSKPQLTFFNELATPALTELFADGSVAEFLAAGGYGLSMGLIDLSPERAAIVRNLESRGVSVTAWLLLAEEDGYWLNADNVEIARDRFGATVEWAADERLALHRIGLDIEPPRHDLDDLVERPLATLWRLLRRRRSPAAIVSVEKAYAKLVAEIHATNRSVETYQFSLLLDERQANSSLLRRTLGIVDVDADIEVLMLYSTYMGESAAHAYFDSAGGIGLGVTGGGVHADDPREQIRLLTWERLERQLLAASRASEFLYVFSLEGCVWNHMLPRFADLDWNCPVPETFANVNRGNRFRSLARACLRTEPLLDVLLPARRS